jgi:hypothetical protein
MTAKYSQHFFCSSSHKKKVGSIVNILMDVGLVLRIEAVDQFCRVEVPFLAELGVEVELKAGVDGG